MCDLKERAPYEVDDSLEDEDDICDLDPDKHCDNCMKCVLGGSDFRSVLISGIELEHENEHKE